MIAQVAGKEGPVKFGLRSEPLQVDGTGPIEARNLLSEPLGANTFLHGGWHAAEDFITVSLPGVHTVCDTDATHRLSIAAEASTCLIRNPGGICNPKRPLSAKFPVTGAVGATQLTRPWRSDQAHRIYRFAGTESLG